jgi:hypothetical protein
MALIPPTKLGKPQFNSFGEVEDKLSLAFPSDLQTKEYYPECIKFGIYERAGLSLGELGGAIKDKFNAAQTATEANVQLGLKNESLSRVSEAIATAENLEARNAAVAELKNNSIEIEKNKAIIGGNIIFELGKSALANATEQSKQKRESQKKPTDRLVQSIYLQMPESLVYNEQVDWQGSDLGIVGAAINGQFSAGAATGALANAGKILGGGAGVLAGLIPGIGSGAAGIVGALLGSETGLSGAIESSFNIKANPFKEQTFQGVPFRPFEFTFNFRPRNETEVEEVESIIRSFRAFSKPSFKEVGQTGTFQYPHEFQIDFLTLTNDNTYTRNQYIPKIKFCICKSVNTNWTGQGWKSFRDGAPVDIQLTLSFEETEIVTQGDVIARGGY